MEQNETGDGGGAPPPLGGRGTPKEQARAIVDRLILETPGGGPHSGQIPALPSQQAQSRGARGHGTGKKRKEEWRRGWGEAEKG